MPGEKKSLKFLYPLANRGCRRVTEIRRRCSSQHTCLLWLLCLLAPIALAQAQMPSEIETVLQSFVNPPTGANPNAGVIRDSAGNFYGTTSYGGPMNAGVVYKVNAAGQETILYSFTGGVDGGNPIAGVIRDSAGNLYGTTEYGGTANAGLVYKLDAGGRETILHSFTGGSDGGNPTAGVVGDGVGNLYGTTYGGGLGGAGVVYKLDNTAHLTVLYRFTGGTDGGGPYAGVTRDSAGNLYGTTEFGGPEFDQWGVVYKLDTSGQETVLYSFEGGEYDGGLPYGGVVRDSSGNLYGTTNVGGSLFNAGMVYKLDTSGQETILYSFTGGADGHYPEATLIRDSLGNLYGTTVGGGGAGLGVVYELNPAGQETVLHSFSGADGGTPGTGGVIRDSAGNLYGTTSGGGDGLGVVYQLNSVNQETVLYTFTGAVGGSSPYAHLTRDSAGNLYGTTYFGGLANAGVVYKLNPNGHETVLYNFAGGADGSNPYAGVIRDRAGNFYGTTVSGGAAGYGVVYKLDTAGHETVLHSFAGGSDGTYPYAGVVRDRAGNLYGTTYEGGTADLGVVYKLDTTGAETLLHTFTYSDGAFPYAGVTQDLTGNIYGTTWEGGAYGEGTVYEIDTTGQETVLYSFTGSADGANPYARVTLDSAGNLYGTTRNGGPCCQGNGVLFKLDSAGQETVLQTFEGANGSAPQSEPILDRSGNLYGTTIGGGATGNGIIYKVDATGHETVLYSFTGGTAGAHPYAGIIPDSAGNLYGTTLNGGTGSGVVFKLRP
jgi:uncharacterized repeat protein (TIGR03803 family)